MSMNLTSNLKLEFLIKLVFTHRDNSDEAYIDSAIDLAYRDFNRTIHGYSKVTMSNLHSDLRNVLKSFIEDIRTTTYTKNEFDLLHEKVCEAMINEFDNAVPSDKARLHYGQAQKWVNMTLKYLLTLSIISPTLADVEINYQHFHVPIDKYILIYLGLNPFSWSRIGKEQYLSYQEIFRDKYPNVIPIAKEFSIWNERDINSRFQLPL
jgi:hypothetical protein